MLLKSVAGVPNNTIQFVRPDNDKARVNRLCRMRLIVILIEITRAHDIECRIGELGMLVI